MAGATARFAGQFGAVLTRSGKPFEVLLSAAEHLSFAGLEIAAQRPAYVVPCLLEVTPQSP